MASSLIFLSGFSQGGIHLQWHKQSYAPVFNLHNRDTIYHVMRIANTSTNNAITVIDLKNETWKYITAPTVNLNATANQKVVMKNNMVGNIGTIRTTDGWQTTSTLTTLPAGLVIEGATTLGFYGYAQTSSSPLTYETKFSTDGVNWTGVYTTSIIPQFTKSQHKIYTIHNNLLKVSNNGGATYTDVNATYTVNGITCIPNNDTLYVFDTQIHRSFDGGLTWNTVTNPSNSITQVAAKNGKELLLLNQFTTPKLMYYSNDCGNTFNTYSISIANNNETLLANEKSFYLYPNHQSKDGINWTEFLPNAHANKPYDLAHTGNIVVEGTGQGYFGYSLNNGYNFTYLANKVSNDGDLMAVKAVDANVFLAADRKGQIFISSNQGLTWSKKITNTTNRIPKKFTVSDNKNVIVLSGVSPYVSFDAGATFNPMYGSFSSSQTQHQSMKRSTGVIVDVAPLYSSPSFTLAAFEFYQTDLSHTRTLISTYSVSVAQDILDIEMADDNTGYFATRIPATNETVIYKTTNAWATTNTISVISTPTAGIGSYQDARLYTFGTNTLIISGSGTSNNNKIDYYHISTDGGLTWNIIHTNFSNPTTALGNLAYRISFFNPNEYMALISNGFSGSIQASVGVFIGASANSGTPSSVFDNVVTDKENSFVLYPNPAREIINVKCEILNEPASITITNIMGQVVLSNTISSQESELNIQSLQSGIYFVTLVQKEKTSTVKFIKE